MKVVAGISVYISIAVLTFGALLADMTASTPTLYIKGSFTEREATRYRRSAQSMCAAFAITPIGWIIAPFVTGFYQSGVVFTDAQMIEFATELREER